MKKLILLYLFCLCVGFSSLSEAGKALTIIPTTKQAVIFTFGGLQNAQTVADVLQRMDEEKLRGTFFVTERELRENQGTIRLIKNHGQEIGIGLRPGDAPTRDAVKGQLERIRTRLQKMGLFLGTGTDSLFPSGFSFGSHPYRQSHDKDP